MGTHWRRVEIGGGGMKTDLQKELESAMQRRESLRIEYMRAEGVVSFINYLIANENKPEEETTGEVKG